MIIPLKIITLLRSRGDAFLHVVLVAIILIFGGTSLYFFNLSRSPEYILNQQEVLLPSIYRLNEERSLQNVKERVRPGSIRVPILIYHSVRPHSPDEIPLVKYYNVAPSSLEKQLQYLRDNNYAVISLGYLADALREVIILPPKSAVLTFDDGWENQYLNAFPLLKKYNDTATFFIFTDAINHQHFLSWDQIREMDGSGMTIGGHTRTHPYLLSVASGADLENEIINGKKITENQLGHPVKIFAYPFGQYNDRIINVVKKAGYVAARSAYKGVYNSPEDLYKLKGIEATDNFTQFVKDLTE